MRKGKFYKITSVHKDDLRILFKNDKDKLKKIDALTDNQMEWIARKMSDDYCEQLFWVHLPIFFEAVIK